MSTDDDRWFEVLQGKRGATDEDTQLAAQLRQHLLSKEQFVDEPHDEAQVKRIMNMLEARGAFDQVKPKAQKASEVKSTLDRLMGWLSLSNGGTHARGGYAWVAMALVAVVAVPVLISQTNRSVDDDYSAKSAAKASAPQASANATPSSSVVSTRNVETEASRIEGALAVHGVKVSREQVKDTLVLTARVPADKLDAVNRDLADWGVAVPATGLMHVVLTPSTN